jgi:hypothetical protein
VCRIVECLEVSPRAERAVLAVQHRDIGFGVGLKRTKGIGQRLGGDAVDRVAGGGPVEAHDGHAAVAAHQNFGIVHRGKISG